jgi:CubicO group peptidase (beta-lactamase class C family)
MRTTQLNPFFWITSFCLLSSSVPTVFAVLPDLRGTRIEEGLKHIERLHYYSDEVIDGHGPSSSIQETMTFHHVPGISIALIEEGKIAWTKTYGVKKSGSPDPVTRDTLFQAASISKPITALGALVLVQQGLVDLDTDINHYLKRWKVPENQFTETQKVTLRRILSHSAGLTVPGFPGYETEKPLPHLVEILLGSGPANTAPVVVDTVPGSIWRYSGGGLVIVQLLIEDITGEAFEECKCGQGRGRSAPPRR